MRWLITLAVCAFFLVAARGIQQTATLQVEMAAALGLVGSAFTVNKFGRNQDSDQTEDSIWDGSDRGGPIRCFDVMGTTPAALYISSDDENDAGLGVTVMALDGDWDEVTIEATLGVASASGTVFAQIGTVDLLRINRMYATSAALVGNIYAATDDEDGGTDGIPDNILTELVASIEAGQNQTLQACSTVPNNFTALLTQFCTANLNKNANANATVRLRSSVEGAASRVQEILQIGEEIYQCTVHDPPVVFVEKTDIELTNVASADDASITGSFDLILFSNTMR